MALFERIPYTIKRSSRRTVALSIRIDGSLEVRAPVWADSASIERFIISKRDWIKRKSEIFKKPGMTPLRFEEGGKILFFGKEHLIELSDKVKKIKADGSKLLCPPDTSSNIKKAIMLFLKKEARSHISERAGVLSEKYSFHFSTLRISSARTRWGSCSSKRVLSFSFRLIMAEPSVVDSVILHELCHTKEMNHSKKFYALLLKCDPEYKKHSAWLKNHRGVMAWM